MKMGPSILAAAVTVIVGMCLSRFTSAAVSQRVRWTVRTFTSNIHRGGSDDTVAIRLVGSKGSTQPHVLNSHRDDFEQGAVDRFLIIVGVDIGTPTSISMIGGGGGDGWHLDKVELELVTEANTGNYRLWTFNCGCWFDADVVLDNVYEGFRHMSLASTIRMQSWEVWVFTSNIENAGTDDDVKIKISGSSGESRLIKLDQPGRDNFRRFTTDIFVITTVELGDPQQLTIEAGEDGDGWNLYQILVRRENKTGSPLTKQYHFRCNHCLFDADHPEDSPTRRIINARLFIPHHLRPQNYASINTDATTVSDGTEQDSTGQDHVC